MSKFIKNWGQKVIGAERRTELDLIRGIAVLFMIFIHVKIYYLSESSSISILGGLIDFMGTVPNASIFLIS